VGKFKTLLIAGVAVSLFISNAALAKPLLKRTVRTPKKVPTTQPAGTSDSAAADDPKAKARAAAMAQYHKVLQCYKSGTLSEIPAEMKKMSRMRGYLPRSAQADLAYIPGTIRIYRPRWWRNMKSSSNVTFKAALWGRPLTANYVPSDMLGGMQAVGVRGGKLVTIVSWRPNMIDNPKPAEGYLAERHKLTKAAIGEAIGWHELGHNYISYFLPLKHVMVLYEKHSKLYYHLQEFYADMTSLYHSSPGGRLALMFTRLEGLNRYRESQEHDRAAHAIGSLILTNVLMAPKKWPSFHFPPKVPEKDIELSTIRYLYEYIDPNWTINEDKALRVLIKKFISINGSRVLRSKGMIALPSRIPFKLMVSDDRSYQVKRDAWVKGKLEDIIKSGRADKEPAKIEKSGKFYRIDPY
jgi:hypothetical protein